jgi:hypothetical protein
MGCKWSQVQILSPRPFYCTKKGTVIKTVPFVFLPCVGKLYFSSTIFFVCVKSGATRR